MRKFSRVILSVVTATALGFGALPGAMAQDEQAPAMDASSSASILESLATADEGLNGPVKVKRNGSEVVVTYTNETVAEQKCSGLALPYAEVVKEGLDKADPATTSGIALLGKFNDIIKRGDSAVMNFVKEGEGENQVQVPATWSGKDAIPNWGKGTMGAVLATGLKPIAPGEAVTWTMANPSKDAVAIILCDGNFGSNVKNYKGIEQSIFFDQVKDKLGPAGSVVDGSSNSPLIAGSITSFIPGFSAIIEFFSGLMNALKALFGGLFGGNRSSASGSSSAEGEGEGTDAGADNTPAADNQ
ncbi:MAG TPA: hypothetical protein H9867_05950 [Candidatus Corynebacterium gallistercoris]|uniref:Secreted protein n=1 Tax=Candidatus Corynebacterium gallistercoris TaxID=2838530 RepID=A0A9D1S0G1_9CORY|nr:hypothetical protein [Candidatus Corynebacterium gallistercoris]